MVGGCHEVVRVETPGEALLCRQRSRCHVWILGEPIIALTECRRHHGRLRQVRRDGIVELHSSRLQSHVLLFKVIVEYDEVIVLLHILRQAVEFLQEVTVLLRGSIVSKLMRHYVLTSEHLLVQSSPMTSALHTLMHIKV